MPDLQARLHTDASRPISMPGFDEALLAALTDERMDARTSAGTRRRSQRAWICAAASVAVLAIIAAALTLPGKQSDLDSGGPASRHSSETASHGVYATRIAGMIISPPEPGQHASEVMVFTTSPRATPLPKKFGAPTRARASCLASPDMTLVETSSQVRIRVSVPHRASGVVPCGTQGLPDPGGSLLAGMVTGLKQPLGDRAVVDDRTGKPVEVFQPTYPQPQYLPAGYAATDAGDTEPMGTTWGDARPGFLAPMAVASRFHPSRGEHRSPLELVVIQAPYDTVNPGASVSGHVTVNEADATVTSVPDARCVTWSPDGRSGLQVCSETSQHKKAAPGVLLGESALVRVARSLP